MTSTQHHPRPMPSSVSVVGGLLLLAAAPGCPSPDAEGKYDRFVEQTEDDRDVPETKMDFGAPVLPDVGDGTSPFDGVYLVAVDTIVSYGLPLQFIGEVTADLDAEGNGTITVVFQPLSLDPASTTTPREEVGEAITIDADVTDFEFTLDFGTIMVTGQANPITGSDIVASLSLVSQLRSEDAWCGTVTGDVMSPISVPLEGSYFAATRLADRSERPTQFPCDCTTVEGEPGAADGCYPRM